MPVDVSLVLSPQQASDTNKVLNIAISKSGVKPHQLQTAVIIRKSIDARRGKISFNLGVRVFLKGENLAIDSPVFCYSNVSTKPEVIIVGAGPAGLFAALRLIELGYKPIIIERGKDVSTRKRDVASLNRNLELNSDSNFAFGEGGAGTFSDGKLYTRSRKRGDINRILHALHEHGAQDEILYEAHPHIGTNVLPRVITSIRKTIEDCGGLFIFNARVDELILSSGEARGVKLSDGQTITGKGVILATGHSAREVYFMLQRQGVLLEAKPFAVGVRVEHPQSLIDQIQYHGTARGQFLPAATYALTSQVDGRGVYSFCMCPGGHIVPAASHVGEVVVNGMSPSSRNSQWANSGIVVEVQLSDLKDFANHNQLAGLVFQQQLEQLAYSQVANGVKAPAQRLGDFVKGVTSSNLPSCSYHPGIISTPMHKWLPQGISSRLREGFTQFDAKMKGFLTNEAIILGVESRTSSPVRIPRDFETLQHPSVKGLFPCGEGAGYAGGIVSSAIDGERCAEAFARSISKRD
jgi:uncharacterized FAD-dependent dehydrogenase